MLSRAIVYSSVNIQMTVAIEACLGTQWVPVYRSVERFERVDITNFEWCMNNIFEYSLTIQPLHTVN